MTNLIIERKTIGELGRHVEVLGLVLLAYLIRITILSTRFLVRKRHIQGVSKKRYILDFLSYFSSIGRILLFHMCFGIRISSPFHLAIQKVSIQNLNCPKNACADMIFIPALRSED